MRGLRVRLKASFVGLSPESAALALVLGVVLGTLPVYGLPTLLCAVAAVAFGVNLAAVQLASQLATPLQLALLVPFAKLGSLLIGSHPWGWNAGAFATQAVVGWMIACLPLGLVAHFLLTWLLRLSLARHLFQRQPAVQAR